MQRVTLITGSSQGIGKSLTEHYLAAGHLVIGCSRSTPLMEHAGYRHFSLDVADEDAVKEMFSEIRKQHGGLDHLINNAGIASMNHALLTPMSTVEKVLRTNVAGTFLLARESARLMQKGKYGRIVNFSTVAVELKVEGEAIYAASKAAVMSLTEILARELAPWNITVNSVAPGPIKTALIENVPEEKLEKLLQQQAIKRFGTMDDVTNVVDFFLRPESSFITGQNIYLGGV